MVGNNASVNVAVDEFPVMVSTVMVPVDEWSVLVCMQTHQVSVAPWTPQEFGQQRGESYCCSKKN